MALSGARTEEVEKDQVYNSGQDGGPLISNNSNSNNHNGPQHGPNNSANNSTNGNSITMAHNNKNSNKSDSESELPPGDNAPIEEWLSYKPKCVGTIVQKDARGIWIGIKNPNHEEWSLYDAYASQEDVEGYANLEFGDAVECKVIKNGFMSVRIINRSLQSSS
jgi:hypothetical protein